MAKASGFKSKNFGLKALVHVVYDTLANNTHFVMHVTLIRSQTTNSFAVNWSLREVDSIATRNIHDNQINQIKYFFIIYTNDKPQLRRMWKM